jgi:hypothetical protein
MPYTMYDIMKKEVFEGDFMGIRFLSAKRAKIFYSGSFTIQAGLGMVHENLFLQ